MLKKLANPVNPRERGLYQRREGMCSDWLEKRDGCDDGGGGGGSLDREEAKKEGEGSTQGWDIH